MENGVCAQESGFVGDPAEGERGDEGKSHEERGGKNETSRGETDVGIEPAVSDDAAQGGGRAGGRVPENEAAEHFDI